LGRELGKGGEGVVFAVDGANELAAKLYHAQHAVDRREKIMAMASSGWHARIKEVAFPIDPLMGEHGDFLGFTMARVGGRRPIHEAYSPTSRKSHFPSATFPFLVRVALNIANAIAKVHETGCVIGDINHSGILVADDATVTLIDSDSFQVQAAGKLYPCKVGVPEFTPPELQGQSLDKVIRAANHDAFGVAVLIFYILFMGRHPFMGRPTTQENPPELGPAIKTFRFAYSARRSETRMEPPPNVPTLRDVPLGISDYFERAFGPGGVTSPRPTAVEWVRALNSAEQELVRCSTNSAHHYFKMAADCPWCRMERTTPGFHAFLPTSSLPSASQQALNVGQLIARINGVSDPGPAPDLSSLMPNILPPESSLDANAARGNIRSKFTFATLSGFASVGCFFGGQIFVGACLLGGLGWLVHSGFQQKRPFISRRSEANRKWADTVSQWTATAGNSLFYKVRADTLTLVEQIKRIPVEQQSALNELDRKRRDLQLARYLEGHLIAPARVKGLGPTRKKRLESYGIESALDVTEYAVRQVPGCASLAFDLVAWRRSIERKFVFNAAAPVSQQDIAAVTAQFTQKSSDLERRINLGIATLQQSVATAKSLRTSPGNATLEIWRQFKQAEANVLAVETAIPKSAKIFGALAVLIGFLIFLNVTKEPWVQNTNRHVDGWRQDTAVVSPPSAVRQPADVTPPLWSTGTTADGRKEFIVRDVLHSTVEGLAFSCGATNRFTVRAIRRLGSANLAVTVRTTPAAPPLFIMERQEEASVADALIGRVIELSRISRPWIEVFLGLGPDGPTTGFRIPPSADVVAAHAACRPSPPSPTTGQPLPLPQLPPPIDIGPASGTPPGQVTEPGMPLDIRPTTTPPPTQPRATPRSQERPATPRQQPRPNTERDRNLSRGTGGLY